MTPEAVVLPQDAARREKRPVAPHTVKPLWHLSAMAPNGTEVFFTKFSHYKDELTWGGVGLADAPHAHDVWKAKLAGSRGALDEAVALLEGCGYKVQVTFGALEDRG